MFSVLWLTESIWPFKLSVAQFISVIYSSFRDWDSSQGILESIQIMKINICSQLPIWWITRLMSQWIYPYFNIYRVWIGHIWSCSVLAADGGNYSKFLSPLHSVNLEYFLYFSRKNNVVEVIVQDPCEALHSSINSLPNDAKIPKEFPPSQVVVVVKNPPANAGDIIDTYLIPGLGRPPRGRHGNPLQYSCLENPMDRGPWWTTVHRVGKTQTQLKQLSTPILQSTRTN